MTQAEKVELKEKALNLLNKNKKDIESCAKKLGVDLILLLEIRDEFRDEFELLDRVNASRCEKVVLQAAAGDDISSTQLNAAKWYLERRDKSFQKITNIKNVNEPMFKPNGKGQALLNKFREREGENGSGESIPAKILQ